MQTRPEERRVIVLITDNVDTSRMGAGIHRDVVMRTLHETGTAVCAITISKDKVRRKLAQAGVTGALFAVSPIIGATALFSAILRRGSRTTGNAGYYARRTGGVRVDSSDEMVGPLLTETMQLLRERYTLGFVPGKEGAGHHKIEVKVPGKGARRGKAVHVLARDGYFRHPTGER